MYDTPIVGCLFLSFGLGCDRQAHCIARGDWWWIYDIAVAVSTLLLAVVSRQIPIHSTAIGLINTHEKTGWLCCLFFAFLSGVCATLHIGLVVMVHHDRRHQAIDCQGTHGHGRQQGFEHM